MYAHLVAGADEKAREDFDHRLNAPPIGWAEVQRRIFTIVEGEN